MGETTSTRRRALEILGVGGAAAIAAQLSATKAGADTGQAMILGANNTADQSTTVHADIGGSTLYARNDFAGGGPGFAITGRCDDGKAVLGESARGHAVNGHSDDTGVGVLAFSKNGAGGFFSSQNGFALIAVDAPSHMHSEHPQSTLGVNNLDLDGMCAIIGASGNAGDPPAERGHGAGVMGVSGTGNGVEGLSNTGHGVYGRTDDWEEGGSGVFGEVTNGSGVQGQSQQGVGVEGHGKTGVIGFGGDLDGTTDPDSNGVIGLGFKGNGVLGQTERDDSAGVRGEAHVCLERGPCEGVAGGTGVHGSSEAGTGVRGESQTGPGVEAASTSGLALRVLGRSGFSTAGNGTVPQGQNLVTIAQTAVTATSHVTVTLMGNPGSRQIHFVQRNPGVGFTVNLTSAKGNQRPATPFSYLVVEPA